MPSFGYIAPADTEFIAPDLEGVNGELRLGMHPDGTMTARMVGKRGRVFAWIELSETSVDQLRDYLNGKVMR